MIKNIIFDMDGVLLDSEKAIRDACAEMFRRRGVIADTDDFLPFTGMGETRFISAVAEKCGVEYEPLMKAEAYEIYGEIAYDSIILFDNICEMIQELKDSGYGIAVASAADETKVKINLKRLGLSADDFGAVVTGSDVTRLKPDPMIFLEAAKRLGAKPDESLVVEDAVSGCKAAKAAGMSCIGVSSTFDDATLKEAGADFVVARTCDILEILKNI